VRDVTPAAQRLASRMGEELVISVVRPGSADSPTT